MVWPMSSSRTFSSHARRRGAGAPPPPPASLSADDLAKKTGLYRVGSDENHIVSISVRDGKLTLRDFYGDNYDILMTPISANRFLIPGTTFEFSPAEAGRPQAWHVIDGEGRRLLELPLMKFDVSKADLPSFAGEYRSDELDVTYTVAVRDSSLVVNPRHCIRSSRTRSWATMSARFGSCAMREGSVTGFTLNRKGARGVRFERVKRAP